MRIAFIIPSFHTLGTIWRRDPQIVKLGAPQISGALYLHGHRDIRQYDFEVQLFELEKAQPGRLNLRVFFEDTKVNNFLKTDDVEIRDQTNLILDTLEVEEAALYGFSCASVLEIYADMHAVANLNMCLMKVLKERFPNCKTVIGGLKISPNTKHRAEYEQMLERCAALDFAAEGPGEPALLNVVDHLNGKSFAELGQNVLPHGHGLILHGGSAREIRLSPSLARDEGLKLKHGLATINEGPAAATKPNAETEPKLTSLNVQLSSTTAHVLSVLAEAKAAGHNDDELPDFGPQGDHERKAFDNPSIFVTPYFDPKTINRRKYTGHQIIDDYHLRGTEWETRLAPHGGDQVAILPFIFMEGCNARCAFCAYSMTKMIKRDVKEVVRSIAWMKDTYGVKYFHFLNTNINGSMQYCEMFCDELIRQKLDIYWSDCANLWALNERVLEKLRKSGCIRFTYGLECPSDRMLDYIGKGITVKQAHQRLKQAHDLGIWNHLLLITGLPTETEEDIKYFEEFLHESKEYSNAYSISSFYLISSSLMGAFPHRYGLEMMPNPSGLLEDSAFNEIGGLPWARKKRQIIESTEKVTQCIRDLKIDPKYWSGAIDLELIFWLYDKLGHDNKKDIVRCYEDAFLGSPAHPKSYAAAVQQLAKHPNDFAAVLEKSKLRMAAEALEIRSDALVLPVESGGNKAEIELRVMAQGTKSSRATGRSLSASIVAEIPFVEALKKQVAEGSELEKALKRSGWSITDRNLRRGMMGQGFRIELGEKAIELLVQPVSPDEQVFLKVGELSLSYTVPNGSVDPTKDPRMLPFLQQIGKYLLNQLATETKAASSYINGAALREFSEALVLELEKTFARELDLDEKHEQGEGLRHGDKFSRVAVAEAS